MDIAVVAHQKIDAAYATRLLEDIFLPDGIPL